MFDFSKKFSLVVKLVAIRVMLTISLSCEWKLHQLDINEAFLNGEAQEEMFMEQP